MRQVHTHLESGESKGFGVAFFVVIKRLCNLIRPWFALGSSGHAGFSHALLALSWMLI